MDKTRHSNQYLFSTLIKCKECGWSFRRVIRTYKNTYVRWVCSGHNGKGTDCCENKTVLDEEELIQTLQDYFAALVKNKKRVTENIVAEFTRVYKVRDENVDYEKQLRARLAKLEKMRTKYMPCTLDATNAFLDAGVLFGPAKAANAGGVATSGLEMCQNSMECSLPFPRTA